MSHKMPISAYSFYVINLYSVILQLTEERTTFQWLNKFACCESTVLCDGLTTLHVTFSVHFVLFMNNNNLNEKKNNLK